MRESPSKQQRPAKEKELTPPFFSLPQVDPESLERDNDRGIDLLGERVGALRQVCVRVCV